MTNDSTPVGMVASDFRVSQQTDGAPSKTITLAGRTFYDPDLDFMRGLLPPFARNYNLNQPGPFRAVLAAGMKMERTLNVLDVEYSREIAGTFTDGSGI